MSVHTHNTVINDHEDIILHVPDGGGTLAFHGMSVSFDLKGTWNSEDDAEFDWLFVCVHVWF